MVNEYNRDDALRHFQRGLALERTNRIKEAVHEYHQALNVYPHLREAHEALGAYYQRCGMLTRAAESFRIASNLDGDFRSFFNLGYVLVRLEQYDSAIAAFEQCLQLEPNDAPTRYELCVIACARGEYQHALDQLVGPLQSAPTNWELHVLRGNCYLGLHQYDAALTAFGDALALTDNPTAQAAIMSRRASIERHRKSDRLGSASDQLYAEAGVIYLGSAQDDGRQVVEMRDYHFTYPDIGVTLQRLLACQQNAHWQFTAVVALDKLGLPLASAIAQIMGTPLRKTTDLTANDTALLVLAIAREAELLQLTIERIPCVSMSFCLGLNWLRHSRLLPEIIGVVTHMSTSVPWGAELRRLRSDGAPASRIDSCLQRATDEIIGAVRTIPLDTNIARPMRDDGRTHRRPTQATNPTTSPLISHP